MYILPFVAIRAVFCGMTFVCSNLYFFFLHSGFSYLTLTLSQFSLLLTLLIFTILDLLLVLILSFFVTVYIPIIEELTPQ